MAAGLVQKAAPSASLHFWPEESMEILRLQTTSSQTCRLGKHAVSGNVRIPRRFAPPLYRHSTHSVYASRPQFLCLKFVPAQLYTKPRGTEEQRPETATKFSRFPATFQRDSIKRNASDVNIFLSFAAPRPAQTAPNATGSRDPWVDRFVRECVTQLLPSPKP